MPVSDEFIAFVQDLLTDVGPLRIKRMFGGAGVYAGDLFFAILVDDMLYLKVDEANRAEYEARGLKPFSYRMKGGRVAAMSYYPPPPEALEDPAIRREWVMKALDAAERSRKGKQVRRRRAKGPGRSV